MQPTQLHEHTLTDPSAGTIGIELLEVCEGRAAARLNIEERHLNAARVVHNGIIFSLADLVFAKASHSSAHTSAGINISVSRLKSTRGKTLFAEATQVCRTPKLSTYVVQIRNDANELVAMLTGTLYHRNETAGGVTEK